ncbi:oligosaccharide repeat unit polymerase [Bacillus sp. BHET2]|uniref:O-antigen polymerase n=1 Tax=Bacillus sp. BHET2 TaxID=2583818 RepID=UPI00110D3AEB|nr:O-antigen polymerase [Bacillus sp. BHET2]TMU84122.1 oligosaccharide repeat unit polymerase [Bacillus sp. BHET2]
MTQLLALLQLLSLISLTIYEYKKKYLSVFMWATLILLFGIPHFLSAILNISDFDSEVMTKASIFVLLFNCIYLLSRILLSKLFNSKQVNNKFLEGKITSPSKKIFEKLPKYLFIILFMSVLIFVVFMINQLGSILNISWGKMYIINRDSDFLNPLRISQILFFASAGVILVYKQNNNKFLFAISFTIILFYSILTGNRITILPLLLVFIIPLIFDSTQKISFKVFSLLSLLGVFSVYLVYFLKLLRIYGGFHALITSIGLLDMNSMVLDMILNGEGELSLRNAFYHFIYYENDFPGFNEGHTYLRMVFLFIPTSLSFGLKPTDFAITMGSAWTGNFSNTFYSMHPTLYGDVFANFWWFGIIWGIFWAGFNLIIDKLANRKNNTTLRTVLLVIFGIMYIVVARGSVYNAVFTAITSFIIIISLNLICKIRIR